MDIKEFTKAYADNELAANRKYKGKTVYISGYVEDFKDENGVPVVYLDIGYYNYERQDAVKSIACRMQKRMLPILAKRDKGDTIRIVGEVVGLVSSDSSVHLKNCLAVPLKKGIRWVVSEIRSLYRDEDDLFRTVTKRIYEEWSAEQEQWHLKKIEFIYEDPEFPVPSDNPAVASGAAAWVARPTSVGICIGGFGLTNGNRCAKMCITMTARFNYLMGKHPLLRNEEQ